MRDNQRRKVYNWEDNLIPTTNDLSKQECIHIIDQLNKVYKCNGRIKFVNRHQHAHGHSSGLITIPTGWAMCWKILIHEYAHVLTFQKYGWRGIEVHGKEFVTTYCILLKNFHPNKPTYNELAKSLVKVAFIHLPSQKGINPRLKTYKTFSKGIVATRSDCLIACITKHILSILVFLV